MTIAVIGAGFGRTGTLSLKAALEELGIGPCYHMTEVFQHPEHAAMWEAAARGEPVDWDRLFIGYRATVDWPSAAFYTELMAAYPAAKVILTVRDPERWYDSTRTTIYEITRAATSPVFRVLARVVPAIRYIGQSLRMADAVVWQGTFDGRFEDRRHAIETFDRWNEQVKAGVPAERLLVYRVSEGWDPLCRFLEVPPPTDKPFPHLNDAAVFRRRIRAIRAVSLGVPTVAALAAAALLGCMARHLTARR
jgi:hypothetical protein